MTEERPLEDLLVAREHEGVLWLTLNRPEAGSALTPRPARSHDRATRRCQRAHRGTGGGHHRDRPALLHRGRPAGVAPGSGYARGDDMPAAEAERIGLINRVVPADELEKVATEWASGLAAGPTRALSLSKSLLNRSLDSDRDTAFREEAAAQEINMGTHDGNEGVRAFVERRDPEFRGW